MGGRRKTRRRRGERRRKTRRKQRGGCPPCLAALALLGGSRKTRRKTRRKARRKARFRRGKRRRKTRRRRGGIGFRNSTPLKSVKKPYDCSEEKKEIERLRQELALRTPPRYKRPTWARTPSSPSPRLNPFHNDYEGSPPSVPRARSRSAAGATGAASRLFYNGDESSDDESPAAGSALARLIIPPPPNTQGGGGRRRTRKKRRKGGNPLEWLLAKFNKKKKKPKRRPFEQMMGFPPTPEQQHAAAAAATKEAESWTSLPSAAEVAAEERFSHIPANRSATNSEYVGAVASHHAGLGEKPRRNQPISKDTIATIKDTIVKLKKIQRNMKETGPPASDFVKKKIKNLEKLLAALEENFTFIKKPVDI